MTNLSVCPKCAFHFRISARERLDLLCDAALGGVRPRTCVSTDPLAFKDTKPYAARLKDGKAKTDSLDALVSAVGAIGGHRRP